LQKQKEIERLEAQVDRNLFSQAQVSSGKQFGLPRQLHNDLGKNFESKLFYELCLIAGINKSHTTAFHP